MTIADILPLVVILALVGASAGVLAGLLGVGGGIILVPAFYYVFSRLGFDGPDLMQLCLATSLATIVVTSVRSLRAHDRKGAVEWPVLRRWAPGIALGAVAGGLLVRGLQTDVLQMIFAVLAAAIGAYMMFGRSSWRLGPEMPIGVVQRVISLVVGLLSVLMGIGGGSFGVPLMTLYGMPIHRAVATAAGFGAVIAVPAVVALLLSPIDGAPPLTVGSVNLPAFGVVIAMTLLTAPLGASLAHVLDPKPLKRFFGVFLMIVAANMAQGVLGG